MRSPLTICMGRLKDRWVQQLTSHTSNASQTRSRLQVMKGGWLGSSNLDDHHQGWASDSQAGAAARTPCWCPAWCTWCPTTTVCWHVFCSTSRPPWSCSPTTPPWPSSKSQELCPSCSAPGNQGKCCTGWGSFCFACRRSFSFYCSNWTRWSTPFIDCCIGWGRFCFSCSAVFSNWTSWRSAPSIFSSLSTPTRGYQLRWGEAVPASPTAPSTQPTEPAGPLPAPALEKLGFGIWDKLDYITFCDIRTGSQVFKCKKRGEGDYPPPECCMHYSDLLTLKLHYWSHHDGPPPHP